MRSTVLRFALPLLALAGCTYVTEPDAPAGDAVVCTLEGWPSVVAEIRDAQGRPAAWGATLRITDGSFADSAASYLSSDGLRLGAGNRRAGTYDVRVSRPFHRDGVVRGVRVPGGACGALAPVVVPVRVELLPDAPPVRSVTILSTGAGFGLPGLTLPLRAHVDAAAGVDTAVTWASSDTLAATVSPQGVVTSRCVASTRTAQVTATSRADAARSGSVAVTVWPPSTPCP